MGKRWNKDVEALLQDYKAGKLKAMNHDLDDLLTPAPYDDHGKLAEEWSTLKSYESSISCYLEAVLDDGSRMSNALREATNNILLLNERIKTKKEYVQEGLEQLLTDTQEVLEEQFENEDLKGLQESKRVLGQYAKAADIIEEDRLASNIRKISDLCRRRVTQIIDKQQAKQERDAQHEKLLEEAERLLDNRKNNGRLREMYGRLQEACRSGSFSKEHEREARMIISRYDETLQRRAKEGKRRLRGVLKNTLIAGGVAAIGYLGYVGIRAATGGIQDQVQAYKERKAEELGEQEALSDLQRRQDSIYEAEEARLLSLRSEIDRASDDLFSLETRRLRAQAAMSASPAYAASTTTISAKTADVTQGKKHFTEESVVRRLAPVLDDAILTLYIEKESNTSYLVDEYGVVLKTMPHTDAQHPGRKTRAGEKRTPEGIYRIEKAHLNRDGHRDKVYGVGFYRIDYRNTDGTNGVLLCSAANNAREKAIREGWDAMNCGVAYYEKDFKELYRMLGDGSTAQVVIENYQRRPLEALGEHDAR
ncbi:hypothetical protein JXA12_00385 [Candidatus Woesearchaeota archaeon]|nr:hypothetical protein [Candidatus Woesearchaeota archaeon]